MIRALTGLDGWGLDDLVFSRHVNGTDVKTSFKSCMRLILTDIVIGPLRSTSHKQDSCFVYGVTEYSFIDLEIDWLEPAINGLTA